MENKHILLNNMTNITDRYSFECLPWAKGGKNAMKRLFYLCIRITYRWEEKEIYQLFIKSIYFAIIS